LAEVSFWKEEAITRDNTKVIESSDLLEKRIKELEDTQRNLTPQFPKGKTHEELLQYRKTQTDRVIELVDSSKEVSNIQVMLRELKEQQARELTFLQN
jgi:hypothetical protein